ncbi:hypothetical protein L7F22_040222 [Adiantum nelumboides]|nr:hypothetical protein [Adiantum nelumboides]
MPHKPNPVWDKHTNVIRLVTTPGQQGSGTRHWQCKYYGESQTSTITRILKHLTGIGTANHCHGCERIPPLVKEEPIREHFSAAYSVPSRGSSMSQDASQDALLGDLGDSHVDAGMLSGQQTSVPSSGGTSRKRARGDPSSHDPVVFDDGVTYLFVQYNNVYVLTAARQNCNAASMLLFLHRVIDVFKHYFEELEEESLRDNFVVVYELLDEMMDFGYPQYTEAKILSEFIKTDAYRMEVTQRPPMAVTNAVSWRSEGIRYKKNEVFLDVVESVNILVNSNGQVVRSDVVGALKMRTYLSGMPECKLGLNDRVLLEAQGRATKGKAIDLDDIKFHQCVRLARFENDRTISFIPPDGAFDLMTYRLSTQVKPLIWVEAQVERHSRSRVEYTVKARSQFKERSTATNVEIELPVSSDATTPTVRTSMGSAVYAPEREALLWKIKSFPGGKDYMLRAQFHLPSITAEESTPEKHPPIRVKFEIPYFTVSGIQVRYLKIIEKSGYQALPWFCVLISFSVDSSSVKSFRFLVLVSFSSSVLISNWFSSSDRVVTG